MKIILSIFHRRKKFRIALSEIQIPWMTRIIKLMENTIYGNARKFYWNRCFSLWFCRTDSWFPFFCPPVRSTRPSPTHWGTIILSFHLFITPLYLISWSLVLISSYYSLPLSHSLPLSYSLPLPLSLSAPLRPFSPKPLFPISALLSPWTRTRRRSRTNTFHRKKNFEKKVASRKLFSQHRYFQNKLNSSERWEGTSPGWFSNFVSSVATFILSIVTLNLGNYFQFRIRLCVTSLCRSLYYFPFFSHNSVKQYIMK